MKTKVQVFLGVAAFNFVVCGGEIPIDEGLPLGSPVTKEIPAFPGAEGFGASTPGGRGGKVIRVTNLNDSGAGSFRAACEESGARIVIFDLGGLIWLTKDIEVRSPFLTIAGQTAPGSGICLAGAGLRIQTHDIVVRGLRIRVGDRPQGPEPGSRDAITIEKVQDEPYSIIIDHCSISWGIDENISSWRSCRDITLQWCTIAEALNSSLHPKGNKHSMGMLIGEEARNVSIHHNLFAHNRDRNPLINPSAQVEVVNNLIYNWEWYGTRTFSNANIVGNYYQSGLDWTGGKGIAVQNPDGLLKAVYIRNNVGPGRPQNSGDDWDMVNGDPAYRSETPVAPLSELTIDDASSVFWSVLGHAGAIVPARDGVDLRVISSARNRTGRLITSQEEVGGWPNYERGVVPADSDQDGMPDEWEIAQGHDPNRDDANDDANGDGYTNIEDYINSLIASPR